VRPVYLSLVPIKIDTISIDLGERVGAGFRTVDTIWMEAFDTISKAFSRRRAMRSRGEGATITRSLLTQFRRK